MKPTLLIVDDDNETQKIAGYALKSENYNIKYADHFHSAQEIIGSEQIDLVVLDYCLPGIDGSEICKSIKGSSDSKNIPVIMWSIDGYSLTRSRCMKAGADIFIEKPAPIRVFLDEIRRLLNAEVQSAVAV